MLEQEDPDEEDGDEEGNLNDPREFSFDKHLQYISEYLGPFTKEYLDACPEFVRKRYFDDNGMFSVLSLHPREHMINVSIR